MAQMQPRPAPRKGLGKTATIFACGVALFSDGYINSASGPVNTILRTLYPDDFAGTNASQLFSSLVFAGTVLGMLSFGYISDRIGRKVGMIFASVWLSIFSLMSGLAYGAGGSTKGLISALIAYRFLLGIGIGAEYPAGSVAASENTEDPGINKKAQHRLFVLATNTQLDLGFALSNFVAYLCLQIFTEARLEWVWRVTLGFGFVVPLVILFFRQKMEEPAHYKTNAMKQIPFFKLPWKLILRKYWHRLAAVSIAWGIYNWIVYPGGIYSGVIIQQALPNGGTLSQQLGYGTLINSFYLPGNIIGLLVVDRLGPKWTMITGLLCQSIVGFILAGAYEKIKQSTAGFAVLYGIYLSFGEFGPGNNLGLLASKTTGPTAVRGVFYAFAAAFAKIIAFIATYVYTPIIDAVGGPGTYRGDSIPVFIGSALSFLSALVVFFGVPNLREDFMLQEDIRFRQYLDEAGYDTSDMGVKALLEQDAIPDSATEQVNFTDKNIKVESVADNFGNTPEPMMPISK